MATPKYEKKMDFRIFALMFIPGDGCFGLRTASNGPHDAPCLVRCVIYVDRCRWNISNYADFFFFFTPKRLRLITLPGLLIQVRALFFI